MAQVQLGANDLWNFNVDFRGQGVVLLQPMSDTVQGAEWQRKVLTELKTLSW